MNIVQSLVKVGAISAYDLGSYHFLPGEGPSVCGGGGPEFPGGSQRGDHFFQWVKGGPEFFEGHRGGGTRKIGDWPSQIDGPLPKRNDSSLSP